MVNHPSTAEFVCIKLIQKLVSDDLTLAKYRDGTAPVYLRELLAVAIAAWNSTTPRGNIRTVLRAILDPVGRSSEFWQERNLGSKVKTPIEFLNSTVRALDGATSGLRLRQDNADQGMSFFTRDDPDGWSELGLRWVDTATVLARLRFSQDFAENRVAELSWDAATYLASRGLHTADEIVDYFDDLMFQGTLSADERGLLLEFLTTDSNYGPLPLDPTNAGYVSRVEEFVGFVLSQPRWHFQ
jgi:uncharacterized protein (DUF1800 family)